MPSGTVLVGLGGSESSNVGLCGTRTHTDGTGWRSNNGGNSADPDGPTVLR